MVTLCSNLFQALFLEAVKNGFFITHSNTYLTVFKLTRPSDFNDKWIGFYKARQPKKTEIRRSRNRYNQHEQAIETRYKYKDIGVPLCVP